jgi:hypothetical protein
MVTMKPMYLFGTPRRDGTSKRSSDPSEIMLLDQERMYA